MDRQTVVYTMEYYLVVKRNKVQIHATRWINLKNLMLNKADTKGYILYASIYMRYPE